LNWRVPEPEPVVTVAAFKIPPVAAAPPTMFRVPVPPLAPSVRAPNSAASGVDVDNATVGNRKRTGSGVAHNHVVCGDQGTAGAADRDQSRTSDTVADDDTIDARIDGTAVGDGERPLPFSPTTKLNVSNALPLPSTVTAP